MKPVRILAIATVASFGMSTAVQAADPLPPLMVDIPAVAAEPSFGWGGFYVGAGIGGAWSSFPLTEFHLSVYVGGNFAIGTSMVAGAEIYATWFTPATFPWRIGGEGRVGFLVTPSVLVYGAVGFAHYQAGNNYLTVGPGVEVVIDPALSLDFAYDYEIGLNVGATGHRVTLTLNWHLN